MAKAVASCRQIAEHEPLLLRRSSLHLSSINPPFDIKKKCQTLYRVTASSKTFTTPPKWDSAWLVGATTMEPCRAPARINGSITVMPHETCATRGPVLRHCSQGDQARSEELAATKIQSTKCLDVFPSDIQNTIELPSQLCRSY
jgi:hypothetical protein